MVDLYQLMRCPKCQILEDKVIDSRTARDGSAIRRRRECLGCGNRYTTYEVIEQAEILVVKRNQTREAMNREKLLRGLVKACEKRPVSIGVLEVAADEIIAGLESCGEREIESRMIGARVMDKLHAIDPVAYVRYASVYRQFQDVGEFIDEIESMQHRVPRTVPHPELFQP